MARDCRQKKQTAEDKQKRVRKCREQEDRMQKTTTTTTKTEAVLNKAL